MDNVLSYVQRPANLAVAANRDIETPLTAEQRGAMIDAVAQKMSEVLDILRIDHHGDPNTRDTPRRVAKMYVEELLAGRFSAPPKITEFATTQSFDELIVTGPIEVRTTCAHHLMPIYGTAIVGIMPSTDGRLIGRVTIDAMVDVIREESDAETLSRGGLREDEDIFASVWKSLRNRWTWLAINLVTAFIASRVIGVFEHSIAQLVALAALQSADRPSKTVGAPVAAVLNQ